MSDNKDEIIFSEEPNVTTEKSDYWKVLIIDDEADIHDVTKIVLKNFEFENKNLKFLSAYNLEEAKKIIRENPDTALILLDIVMEEEDSGLQFVKYLREELKNNVVRIILRTGQPGSAPPIKVVIDYDINDYKEKTELTKDKFFSAIIMALRSYEVMRSLTNSVDKLKTQSEITKRFIPADYEKILNKNSLEEIKLGDYSIQNMSILIMNLKSLVSQNQIDVKNKINLLNTCLQYLNPIIIENHGVIDTFLGEAIMAIFFGPPDEVIQASIKIIKDLNQRIDSTTHKMPVIHIGIHTGPLTFGMIGSEDRLEYATIGETINLALHLENLNRHYHSTMLVSEEALSKMTDQKQFHYRWIANLKDHGGKHLKPIKHIYEFFDGDADTSKELKDKTRELFEEAVNDYIGNHADRAMDKFTQILEINPDDKVAEMYVELLKQS